MKLNIFEEVSITDEAKQSVLDALMPFSSQGINAIPAKQLLQILKRNPDIEGININVKFLQDIFKDNKDISIEQNKNGVYLIKFFNNSLPKSKKKKNSDDIVHKNAMNKLQKDIKDG